MGLLYQSGQSAGSQAIAYPTAHRSSAQGDVNRPLFYRERRDAATCPARLTLPDAVTIFGSACLWGLMMRADGPNCRFCAAPLVHELVDLGMSPLCESFLAGRASSTAMEPFYPLHVLVCDGCFLVQLQEYVSAGDIFTEYAYFSSYSTSLGRARAALLRDDHARGSGSAPTAWSSSSPATTAICCSISCRWACRCWASSRRPTSREARSEKGIPTLVEFFGRALADELVADGKPADLIVGNNVLAQVPGPQRLRRRHGASC